MARPTSEHDAAGHDRRGEVFDADDEVAIGGDDPCGKPCLPAAASVPMSVTGVHRVVRLSQPFWGPSVSIDCDSEIDTPRRTRPAARRRLPRRWSFTHHTSDLYVYITHHALLKAPQRVALHEPAWTHRPLMRAAGAMAPHVLVRPRRDLIQMTMVRSVRVRRSVRLAVTAASAALMTVVAACGGSAPGNTGGAGPSGGQINVAKDETIAAKVPQQVAQTGTLRVASEVYPPAVIVPPEGGEPSGWEVAIAKDIATVMGLKAQINIVPFDGLIASLQANRFDVAMGEISVAPERQKLLWFVSDHVSADSFLVPANSKIKEIPQQKDLCGRKVAVLLASAEQQIMDKAAVACKEQGLPALAVDTYKEQNQANLALQGGKADLSIGTTSQLAYVLSQAPNQFLLIDAPFVETGLTGIAIADTPYDSTMAHAVQAATQKLIDSGRMQEILDQFNAGKGNVKKAEIHAQTGP
jgi:polar amino acid transport system substrate-binding protein